MSNVIAVSCKLPPSKVAQIDRMAERDFEPRSAWMRRVLLAELRRLETEGKIPKDVR